MTEHRRGWWRTLYYYMDWEYKSDKDLPDEKSVKLKQTLMRQVSLSKLKMNKTRVNIRIPPDLQPLPKCCPKTPVLQPLEKKIDTTLFNNLDLSTIKEDKKNDIKYVPPRSSPVEISQKQQRQRGSRYG